MAPFREYNPLADKESAVRIWSDVGWLDPTKEDQKKGLEKHLACGPAFVAEVNGVPECLVCSAPGTIRYLEEDLPFSGITGVTTSLLARKQGLARKLTAHAIARSVADGAIVSGLGMFEQGYYNRLGYGSLGYMHTFSFQPQQLTVTDQVRVPHRLTKNDAKQINQARINRYRGHGAVTLPDLRETEAELLWSEKGFGLGYFDGPDGELTHFLWVQTKGEHGPFRVAWLIFQNREQMRELLGLIRQWGDQVAAVHLQEPPCIQFQDLLNKPFTHANTTRRGEFECKVWSGAHYQLRICDLHACLEKTHLGGPAVRFNLQLSDPIAASLPEDSPWRGCGGEYIVTLGEESSAETGQDGTLPTLQATVNAFTRLWWGVRSATSLWMTDDLDGPPELLKTLDRALALPQPHVDWEF